MPPRLRPAAPVQLERPRAIDSVAVNAVLIAVRQAANVLCDRWSLLTLLLAHTGVHRFGEFRERSGMANRLLTSRLAMLEEQEIIVRLPYTRRPLRHESHLSHMGLELFDVFATMAQWEAQWYPGAGAAARLKVEHLACGAPRVAPVSHCASCGQVMSPRDISLKVSQREVEQMPAKQMAYRRSTLSAANRGLGEALPLAHCIDIFGDKWSIEILMCALMWVRNFGDFQSQSGISTNILADRLTRLTGLGIMRQTTDEDRFGKGAYVLTAKGLDIYPILIAIQAWADRWLRERYRSPLKLTHRPCGHTLRLRVSCDHCGQALGRANSRLTMS